MNYFEQSVLMTDAYVRYEMTHSHTLNSLISLAAFRKSTVKSAVHV